MTDPSPDPVIGETRLVGGPAHQTSLRPSRRPGPALSAAIVAAREEAKVGLTVILSTSEARADELGRALGAMVGSQTEVLVLPPWDCLPYDHASPSRDCQGRRLEVLARLARARGPQILVVSPEAAMQRLPPVPAREAAFVLRAGDCLDREALQAFARRTGYVADDRIDEPGEIAILGEVVDIFPASASRPVRLTLLDDRIETLRSFDPLSQRSDADLEILTVRAASERLSVDDEVRAPGCEHRLGQTDGPLQTLFELCDGAVLLTEAGGAERCLQFLEQVREAHVTAQTFGDASGLPAPKSLYLTPDEAERALVGATPVEFRPDVEGSDLYALRKSPGRALKADIEARCAEGRKVVVSGLGAELKMIQRLLKRQSVDLPPVPMTWSDIVGTASGGLYAFEADLGSGFDAPQLGVTLITASDILGGRVAQGSSVAQSIIGEPELRTGDVVIHEDHGLGVLEALERIEIDGFERDVIRLAYQGGATVLAPVEEFGRIWRYGSEPAAVTLDRLGSDGWIRRRAEVSGQIDRTAARLVVLAAERDAVRLEPVTPPRQAFARFAAGFPFPESVDQAAAIAAVVDDLASGRSMSRLVCGDVGFGKTEVALRAAAAVALSGRQVALAAPTTQAWRSPTCHVSWIRRRRPRSRPVWPMGRSGS